VLAALSTSTHHTTMRVGQVRDFEATYGIGFALRSVTVEAFLIVLAARFRAVGVSPRRAERGDRGATDVWQRGARPAALRAAASAIVLQSRTRSHAKEVFTRK